MKITILGSGTCVPNLERNAPGYLLEIDDKKMLVDCGSGSLLQLEKIKKGLYKDVNYIFVTHTHTDHISDINALIQALNWTPGFTREKELVLIGPKGFNKFYLELLKPISKSPPNDEYEIKIKEIEDKLEFDGFTVKVAKTIHSDNSIAYRFEKDGKSLVISGDTDYDKGIIEFSEKANLLIVECSFPDEEKCEGHLTPTECGKIAAEAKVKKLVLSHFYPTSLEEKRLEVAKSIFENTILAEDLMVLEV